MSGFIYVLSNPSMPGLLKIGFTERSVDERVSELNRATGVPESFIVECTFTSEYPQQDELKIHQVLAHYRKNKEFFDISFDMAFQQIKRILKREHFFIQKHRLTELLSQERYQKSQKTKEQIKRENSEKEQFEKLKEQVGKLQQDKKLLKQSHLKQQLLDRRKERLSNKEASSHKKSNTT